jgi:hypothetical protein
MNTQDFISITMLNNIKNGYNFNDSNGIMNMITNFLFTIIQIILISSIKQIEEVVKIFVEKFKSYINLQTTKQINIINNSIYSNKLENGCNRESKSIIKLDTIHDRYSISIKYYKPQEENNKNNTIDQLNYNYILALFYKFSTLCNLPNFILVKNEFIPSIINIEFELTSDINCIIKELYHDVNNDIDKCVINLYSNKLTSFQLTNYIKVLYKEYEEEKISELNNNLYIFEAIENSNYINNIDKRSLYDKKDENLIKQKEMIIRQKEMIIQSASKYVVFSKKEFYSNKNFNNILGSSAKIVFKRLEFFKNNKEWYKEKGIPFLRL